jgi:hypothetical protein
LVSNKPGAVHFAATRYLDVMKGWTRKEIWMLVLGLGAFFLFVAVVLALLILVGELYDTSSGFKDLQDS